MTDFMKIKRNLALATFAALGFILAGCQHNQDVELNPTSMNPSAQFIEPEPTQTVIYQTAVFGTNLSVLTVRNAPQDVVVKVTKTESCPPLPQMYSNCTHAGDSFSIKFVMPGNSLTGYFAPNPLVSKNDGSPIDNGGTIPNGFWADSPFQVRLTRNQAFYNDPLPTMNEFNAGGVCIIAIIQDIDPLAPAAIR